MGPPGGLADRYRKLSVTVLACSDFSALPCSNEMGEKWKKTGVRFETQWPKHKGEACPAVLGGSRGE